MKPVKLTMQAFGSYGNKTQIDFEQTNQNLFLVTGDTGAGKTTIFDAIVFALYGEASSSANRKEGVILQSQFVELNIEPFVELTFSEQQGENRQLYTVRRVPRHLKLLTRGTGKNSGTREVTGSVSLIMPDGTEYPQKEADRKLGEILGLTKNQFMQVAMIAQGEFMELLRAKSDDKKVIFRKLFNTELYQSIVEELMNRKRALEKEIAQIKTICQTEAAHVVIPEECESCQELDNLKKQVCSGEIVQMERFLHILKELCEELEQKVKNSEEELKNCSKIRDEKRDNYTSAEQLLKLYQQLESARKQLEDCQNTEAQMKTAEKLSWQLRAAYEIKSEYARFLDVKNNFSIAEAALKEQMEKRPHLEKIARKERERAKELRKMSEQEVESYSAVYERVRKELNLIERIKETKDQAEKDQTRLANAQAAVEKAENGWKELEKKEELWRNQAEELSDIRTKQAIWQGKKQKAVGLAVDVQEMHRHYSELQSQQMMSGTAKKAYAASSQLYDKENQKYETMRRSFLDAQAGFLARELRPGKPCPVCGSLEHPSPCVVSELHENLTREILEAKAEEITKLREKQEKKAAEARSASDLLEEKMKVCRDFFEKLCMKIKADKEDIPDDIPLLELDCLQKQESEFTAPVLRKIEELLNLWQKQLQEEGKELEESEKKLTALQEALSHIEESRNQSKKEADEASQVLTQAIAEAKSSKILLEDLEKSREYPSEAAARQEYASAREKRLQAERLWKEADEKANEASKAFHQCETLILRYEKELPVQKALCQEREKSYQLLLKEKELTETEWEQLTQMHSKEKAEQLQLEITDWKQRRAAADAAKKAADKAIGGKPYPDMETFRQQMLDAQEQLIQLQKRANLYQEQQKADQSAYNVLAPRMEERGKVIEKHSKIDNLYRLLSGNVPGSRMDLETFVQRYYLEKILNAANRRFTDMSAGQFELRMTDESNAGKGKNRGLDLMVYSNVTGKEREIRTLSGGESFMAALSLALGMADQIQENSAAVNLDVMFVDEGFGSLDEHSREQAVKVLQELAGGSKLIGIISHVTELKQEIEDQLIVSKDEKGSHVTWQIS